MRGARVGVIVTELVTTSYLVGPNDTNPICFACFNSNQVTELKSQASNRMTYKIQDHGPECFGLYHNGSRLCVIAECSEEQARKIAALLNERDGSSRMEHPTLYTVEPIQSGYKLYRHGEPNTHPAYLLDLVNGDMSFEQTVKGIVDALNSRSEDAKLIENLESMLRGEHCTCSDPVNDGDCSSCMIAKYPEISEERRKFDEEACELSSKLHTANAAIEELTKGCHAWKAKLHAAEATGVEMREEINLLGCLQTHSIAVNGNKLSCSESVAEAFALAAIEADKLREERDEANAAIEAITNDDASGILRVFRRLTDEVSKLTQERDKAVAEANRRDAKWEAGIDHIAGQPLQYDGMDRSLLYRPTLDQFINGLRAAIERKDAALKRAENLAEATFRPELAQVFRTALSPAAEGEKQPAQQYRDLIPGEDVYQSGDQGLHHDQWLLVADLALGSLVEDWHIPSRRPLPAIPEGWTLSEDGAHIEREGDGVWIVPEGAECPVLLVTGLVWIPTVRQRQTSWEHALYRLPWPPKAEGKEGK